MKRSSNHPASAPSLPASLAVPSVARAFDVLEYLQKSPPLTLSELARALRISPSSLLAILRTLGARGYVERDEGSNRYQIGPALERLAAEGISARSVSAAAEAVAALARSAILASSSDSSIPLWREALVALGLAGRQLSALLLEEEPMEERRPAAEPVWQSEASGPLAPAELDRFLAGDLLATLCCVKPDGYPYSVPVWYQWEDGRFWVVPRAGAAWARYLEGNPRVSLAVSEHHPPLRRVLVEGRAERITGPGSQERAWQLVASMARRYLGPSASAYLEATVRPVRQMFAIVPERMVTWHGLASHPRYRAGDRTDVGDSGVA